MPIAPTELYCKLLDTLLFLESLEDHRIILELQSSEDIADLQYATDLLRGLYFTIESEYGFDEITETTIS